MVQRVRSVLGLVVVFLVGMSAGTGLALQPAPVAGWDFGCPSPPPPESDGGGFEWLSWHAPDRVAVDHPLLVGITADSDDMRMRSHVDMTVRVLFENETVFESSNVHEHDGLHTLAFTPDRVGVWSLQAQEQRRDRVETFTHHVQVCAPELADWESLEAWEGVGGDLTVHDHGLHLLLDGATHGLPMLGLFDVRDPDGRLTYSGWNGHFHSMMAEYDTSRPGAAELFVLPDMDAKEAVWTQRMTVGWDGGHAGLGTFWDPLLATRECASDGLRLVTDPDSTHDGTLTWQADSDLRFSLLDDSHRTLSGAKSYRIERLHPAPGGGLDNAPFIDQRVVDPFGGITLRLPDPGHYMIHARAWQTGQEACTEFLIVPNTAVGRVGSVGADIRTNPSSAKVTLTAEDDEGPFPHYEFATRVYQKGTEDTPGRLVWMGKLHAHAGTATFRLAGLPAGHYEVITYPSPQDQGVPPVRAPGDDGFRWTFSIGGSEGVNATEEAVTPEAGPLPGPTPLAALLLAGALIALRRRHC